MAIRWMFAAVAVAALVGVAGHGPARADRAIDVCAAADAPPAPGLTVERLDALKSAGTAVLNAVPETGSDPLAVTMHAVPTPEGLARWVSDNTVLRAYRGTLRGAKGVLGDRQGNSLDRSLLLAELLTFSGYDVRLARATVSGSQLAALKAQLGRAERLPEFAAIAEEHVGTLGAADTAVSDLEAACALALAVRIDNQAERLLAILNGAGIKRVDQASVDQALADHWWVQYDDAGTWRDLDPTGLLVVPEWTGASETLPQDLAHSVSIAVTARIERDGRVEEVPLIEIRDAAATFSDGAITLSFEPKGIAPGDPANLEPWVKSVEVAARWAPVLRYGDEVWGGRIFGFDGSIAEYRPGLAGQARTTASTAGSMLGGAIGGGRRGGTAAGAGAVTAVWIDYRIHVPGRDRIHERRSVFDLGETTAERAAPTPAQLADRTSALLGQHEIYVTSADPAAFSMPVHSVREALAFVERMQGFMDRTRGSKPIDPVALANLIPRPTPVALYALLAIRSDLGAGVPQGLYSSPTIFSFWTRRSRSGDAVVGGFDIVRNDVPPGTSLADAVRLGVIDTVVENFLLAGLPGSPDNASTVLAAGGDWRVASSIADLAALDLPAGIAGLIRAEIARGHRVIVPSGKNGDAALAYWRFDPHTGTILGMTAQGTGGVAAEYGRVVQDVAFKTIGTLGCLQLAYAFIFDPTNKHWTDYGDEVVSLIGCVSPGFKALKSWARKRKIARVFDKIVKNPAYRKEYGIYQRVANVFDKLKDVEKERKFLNSMDSRYRDIYRKFKYADDMNFDDVKLMKEILDKMDPYITPVKQLGLFFWKAVSPG